MSQDVPVGTVFNIASYSALLIMVAHQFNMLPGRYIHSMGDAHVYTSQVEKAKEQLKRSPRPLPQLELVNPPGSIFDYTIENLKVTGYDPDEIIVYPIAV